MTLTEKLKVITDTALAAYRSGVIKPAAQVYMHIEDNKLCGCALGAFSLVNLKLTDSPIEDAHDAFNKSPGSPKVNAGLTMNEGDAFTDGFDAGLISNTRPGKYVYSAYKEAYDTGLAFGQQVKKEFLEKHDDK